MMSEEELAKWLTARAVQCRLNGMLRLSIRVRTGLGFYAACAWWEFASGEIRMVRKRVNKNGPIRKREGTKVTLVQLCRKLTGRQIETVGYTSRPENEAGRVEKNQAIPQETPLRKDGGVA